MFSSFTFMECWYLYTLSHNNYTFYVGITRYLEKRYKYHCNYPYENTHEYIHWIKEAGFLPKITIHNSFISQRDAEHSETSLIRYFVSINNKLCNVDINPLNNRFIKCVYWPLYKKKKRLKAGYAKKIVKDAKDNFFNLVWHYNNKNYKYNG